MTKKSIETPKASSKPDDLIKPKTKDGTTELSEEELGKVSGGMKVAYKDSGQKIKWNE